MAASSTDFKSWKTVAHNKVLLIAYWYFFWLSVIVFFQVTHEIQWFHPGNITEKGI